MVAAQEFWITWKQFREEQLGSFGQYEELGVSGASENASAVVQLWQGKSLGFQLV